MCFWALVCFAVCVLLFHESLVSLLLLRVLRSLRCVNDHVYLWCVAGLLACLMVLTDYLLACIKLHAGVDI